MKNDENFDVESKSQNSGFKRSVSFTENINKEEHKLVVNESVLRKVDAKRKKTIIEEKDEVEEEDNSDEDKGKWDRVI